MMGGVVVGARVGFGADACVSRQPVSQQAGVAVGSEMPCLKSSACERTAVLKISVDPSKVIGSDAAVVRITGLGGGVGGQDVAVFIRVNVAIGIPGTTKN